MKHIRSTAIYFAVFLLFVVGGYILLDIGKTTVYFNETTAKVDIADDDEERQLGLGDYESLEGKNGLLFVFEEPGKHGIWMKDVEFPIDVVWLNDSKSIVSIVENMQPSSYPNSYRPEEDSMYVIELPDGFVEENNVSEGDNVEFSF